jgi:hypothetical protein
MPWLATAMSLDARKEDLLIAAALTRFSADYEPLDPELAEHARQLAADQLLEYDLELGEARYELLL